MTYARGARSCAMANRTEKSPSDTSTASLRRMGIMRISGLLTHCFKNAAAADALESQSYFSKGKPAFFQSIRCPARSVAF